MSALETVLEKVKELSEGELLTVLESVTNELRHKGLKNGYHARVGQTVFYQATPEEVATELAKIFTSEELAKIEATDISNISFGSKSLSQTVIEDREDRV